MALIRTKAVLRVVSELLIVFAGVVGVAGMFLDYYYFTEPEIITNETITLKYYVGLLAVIAHSIILMRARNKHIDSNNRKEN